MNDIHFPDADSSSPNILAGEELSVPGELQQLVVPEDVATFRDFRAPFRLKQNCPRHLDLACKAYALFCMGEAVPGQPSYSQAGSEDYSIERRHNESLDEIVGAHLILLIEDYGIENPEFLRFVRTAGEWEACFTSSAVMNRAIGFYNPKLVTKEKGSFLGAAESAIETRATRFRSFLEVVESVASALEQHGEVFMAHGICREPQVLAGQARLLHTVLREGSFTGDGSKIQLSLPEQCRSSIPPEFHVRDYDTLDQFIAKRQFLEDAGFAPHMEYLLTLGMVIYYAAQAEACERAVYREPFGVHLDLVTGTDGFFLELEGFTHPKLGLNRPLGEELISRLVRENTDLMRELIVHGMVWCAGDGQTYLLDREPEDGGKQQWVRAVYDLGLQEYGAGTAPRWRPGLTLEELSTWGDDYWRELMVSDYCGDSPGTETAFRPYKQFQMGGDFKLQVVGADNMQGKTWGLRALPAVIVRNQRGRRVPALGGAMSMCDGIYHNIQLERYYGRQPSGLEGDLIAVGDFLKYATPFSAGFFDEIFGKASAPCELSFAWACFEEMERGSLVALCSSHNPFLREFGWTDGLHGLQGHFSPNEERERGEPRQGFRSLKMDDHDFLPGHVTVSEGFRWADAYLPEKVAERARSLFRYLTGVEPTR